MIPILLAITMAAATCLPVGQAVSGSAPGDLLLSDLTVQPNPHLGVAFPGGDPATFHLISEAGMGVARMDASWDKYEPSQGTFLWGDLDRKITAMQYYGIEPFITLESDAVWGVESTTETARNRPPLDLAVWKNFIRAMVERYDYDGTDDLPSLVRPVRYYQVANEWMSKSNTTGGWTGTRDQFIEFVNVTYDAVKAGDPDAILVLGGMSTFNIDMMALREGFGNYTIHYHFNDSTEVIVTPADAANPGYQEFLDGVYRTLRECRYDYVDGHLYGPLEHNDSRVALLADRAPKMKMVTSECGGPSRDYDDDITPEDHFMTAIELNLELLSKGYEFALWFRMGETPGATWGNIHVPLFDSAAQPKAGYWAYKLLGAVLENLERVQKIGEGAYIIHRTDASPALVAWNSGGSSRPLPPVVPATQVLRVTDAATGTYVLELVPGNGTIALSDLPVVATAALPGQ